jgi:hypothetical protein
MPDEVQDQTQTTPPAESTPSLTEWREAKKQAGTEVSDASLPDAESAPEAEAGENRSEDTQPEEQEAKAEDPPKPRRRKLQEEVGYLRRIRREEREQYSREVLELQAQVNSLRQSTPQREAQEVKAQPDDIPPRPLLENFSSVEEWQRADTKWFDLRDEIRDRKKSEASEQQRREAEWTKAQRHWSEISEKAEREQPGFNEGIDALVSRGYVSPALGRTIVQEAVDAPEAAVSVARYLTQKPEEAQRISALSEQRTVLAVGRLFERFANPVIQHSGTAATKQPAVPAKTTVLNGSGVQGKNWAIQ